MGSRPWRSPKFAAELAGILPQIEKITDKLRDVVVVSSACPGDFSAPLIARVIRSPVRGVRIILNRLVRNRVIIFEKQSDAYRYASSGITDRILACLGDKERQQLHNSIRSSLMRTPEYPSGIQEYHVAYHSLISQSETAQDTVRNALELCMAMGYDALCSTLLDQAASQSAEWLGEWEFVDFEIRWFTARGEFTRAMERVRGALGPTRPAGSVPRTVFLLHLLHLRSLTNSTYPLLRILCRPRFTEMKRLEPASSRMTTLFLEECWRTGAIRRMKPVLAELQKKWSHIPSEMRLLLLRFQTLMALKQGESALAADYLGTYLRMQHSGYSRAASSQGLLLKARYHIQTGEYRRAQTTLDLVRRILRPVTRPRLAWEYHQVSFQLALDRGDLAGAEAGYILLCDKLPVNGWQETMDLIKVQILLRQDLGTQAMQRLQWIAKNRPSFSTLRSILSLLPDCGKRLPDQTDILFSSVLSRVDPVTCRMISEDVLAPVIQFRLRLMTASSTDPADFETLATRCVASEDPIAIAHILIAAYDSDTLSCIPENLRHESSLQILRVPETQALLADVYLAQVEHSVRHDGLEHSESRRQTFAALRQARSIAKRLGDIPRTRRVENLLGSMIGDVSSVSEFHEGDAAIHRELDLLAAAEDMIAVKNILEVIFQRLIPVTHMNIFSFGDREFLKELCSGTPLGYREQRSLHREMETQLRSGDSQIVLPGGHILTLLYTREDPWGCLILHTSQPGRLSRVIRTAIQSVARIIALKIHQIQGRVPTVPNEHIDSSHYPTESFGMIGTSRAMQTVRSTIQQLKDSRAPVLIVGETGVGKELAARAIHRVSGRSGTFVPYNCGATPANLMESEMFGHVRGAFTGAVNHRKGAFVSAHCGTIFLDEIAEMSMDAQVKLLRVLQEHVVRPLGSDREIPVDVRVISATNRNLYAEMKAGRFREDLYYRLVVVEIQIPSLRERICDIPLLVQYFLQHIERRNHAQYPVPSQVMDMLRNYRWPGNIRELRNLLEMATSLGSPGTPISAALIRDRLHFDQMGPVETLAVRMERTEREYIAATLDRCQGRISKTASLLGISRQALFKKIKRYSILFDGHNSKSSGDET